MYRDKAKGTMYVIEESTEVTLIIIFLCSHDKNRIFMLPGF